MSQVALVTGGGRGFGRAFALALARDGWRVAVASRSRDELDATIALLRAAGTGTIAIPTDVTDEAGVRAMVAATESQLGPIDLLVNNAGAGPPFGPTWEVDTSEWWRNLEVNLRGPLLCCHAVLPGMIRRGRGRIINVASGAGTVSIPYMSAYVTAKAALIRLTEVLAGELRPHGVAVFAIQPGTVRTAMAESLIQSEAGRRWLPWFQQIFDEHRDDSTGPGEELVLYLASGQADALSGRFFQAPGAPNDLTGRTEEIVAQDLCVLRLRS
jgi:NAD(P)-dependent dehydrogenase (short-subunit alcohol dehydrogenase family)